MKKMICGLAICVTLMMCIITVFGTSKISIKIGNQIREIQNPILINNDRIYVSIRDLCNELDIPIHWDENKNEVHLDIYNKPVTVSDKTEFKSEGVIPDEETAYLVGKTILEKYVGKSLEYETEDKVYYLKVTYNELLNAWDIVQWWDYKNSGGWAAGNIYLPHVIISKSSGEVLKINTYSSIERLTDGDR